MYAVIWQTANGLRLRLFLSNLTYVCAVKEWKRLLRPEEQRKQWVTRIEGFPVVLRGGEDSQEIALV